MRKPAITVITALLLFSASTVLADDYPFYGGFGIGFSQADSDCDYHGYNCDGDDSGFKVYAGKQIHRNLAIEIAIVELGKLDDEDTDVTTTADSSGINLSLLGIIPLNEFGYFYGKIGAIRTQTDYRQFDSTVIRSEEEDTDLSFGAGFAYVFDPNYEVRIEFERLNELNDDFSAGGAHVTFFSIAGGIRFD